MSSSSAFTWSESTIRRGRYRSKTTAESSKHSDSWLFAKIRSGPRLLGLNGLYDFSTGDTRTSVNLPAQTLDLSSRSTTREGASKPPINHTQREPENTMPAFKFLNNASITIKRSLLTMAALLLQACVGGTVCDCPPNGFELTVPNSATTLHLSGDACQGATVSCRGRAPASEKNLCEGDSYHRVDPVGPGTCHLEVEFANAALFTTDIEIHQGAGCCSELYPEDISAIVVK